MWNALSLCFFVFFFIVHIKVGKGHCLCVANLSERTSRKPHWYIINDGCVTFTLRLNAWQPWFRIAWVCSNNIWLFYHKKLYSMLLWVFTVIDRRVVQSCARISVTKLAAPRVPLSVLTAIMASSVIYLTNRFQVAVRLFNNRSQRTSKCDKNKKVAHII